MSEETFVLAITGPTGSGKSTVAEKVAKQLEQCANIDADHIKHMIVGGFYVDEANPEDPEGWGFSEWELVGDNIGLLTSNFLDHGYSVIINGYIDELAWLAIGQHVSLNHKVLLLPHVDTVISRDTGRTADMQMGGTTVALHHHHFSTEDFFKDFIKLDTTSHSVDETVKEVLRILSTHE